MEFLCSSGSWFPAYVFLVSKREESLWREGWWVIMLMVIFEVFVGVVEELEEVGSFSCGEAG